MNLSLNLPHAIRFCVHKILNTEHAIERKKKKFACSFNVHWMYTGLLPASSGLSNCLYSVCMLPEWHAVATAATVDAYNEYLVAINFNLIVEMRLQCQHKSNALQRPIQTMCKHSRILWFRIKSHSGDSLTRAVCIFIAIHFFFFFYFHFPH